MEFRGGAEMDVLGLARMARCDEESGQWEPSLVAGMGMGTERAMPTGGPSPKGKSCCRSYIWGVLLCVCVHLNAKPLHSGQIKQPSSRLQVQVWA